MQREIVGVRSFVGHRFGEAWADPVARQMLAKELQTDLSVDVAVRDNDGTVLGMAGDACPVGKGYSVPVVDNIGAPLGSVDVCSRRLLGGRISAFGAMLAACFALWLISWRIGTKITRNLEELERAAIEIGHGRYEPDIRMDPGAPGEYVVLAEALRDMGSKIKTQLAEQRELLASVSHEIRSPLARIRLLLELSRPSAPPDDAPTGACAEWKAREKAIGDMEREIEEIDELVGGLLANSRVDFSALSRRSIDVETACARAVERAGAKAKVVVTGDKRSAELDATLFARAMANLIENATTHGEGADEIDIAFNSEAVRIDVLDRGPGLLPGEPEKIFQSFYRRPTKTHESLGLGLALVRKIAEAHGGSASARNREGGGAVIGFEIPLAEAAAAA